MNIDVQQPAVQQQIDAGVQQLSRYIEQAPWNEWMVEVFSDAIGYAAESIELSMDEILDFLDEEPFGQMAHAHVFEHFVTTETNEDGESVLQAFIRTQLKTEKSPVAHHYLQALADSELGLWEVLESKGNYSARVRPVGDTSEGMSVGILTETLPENICIAARLLMLPSQQRVFAFALLPLEKSTALEILEYQGAAQAEMYDSVENLNQLSITERAEVDSGIREELVDLLFHETLTSWIAQGFEE